MLKKTMLFILSFVLCVSLVACTSKETSDGTAEAFAPTGEFSADNACVDISIDNDGYYSLMSNVTVHFGDDGEILYIDLNSPTLLAFKVSDRYKGGVYLYSGEAMDDILFKLKTVLNSLNDTENTGLLESVISELEYGGPIEGAST